ncbi:anti-sigma factor domain-containing protein [Amycolatopsis roodepoortensis]|uniref:Regulator of SigK n=1 Tax=Amycolatopsis roodepoortensis TaxID=700274 RepID=A0ABR9KYJ3_9PSEU|nr:anti-sigma factor [Amycolatopsis roodepoortensis]MBE1573434.1 anti-sigma factor RsiW [Amycolatopsis roodepoortensis]
MTAELHTLTGAYAVDAVPEEEAAAFERHLRGCPACGQEVRELREAAARLGSALATSPPPRLREATLTEVARTRQWPPLVAVARQGGPVKTRIALWGAAAAAVGALVFSLVTTTTDPGTDPAQQRLASVNAVLTAPDASTVKGAEPRTTTVVISRSQGKVVVLAGDLPPLAPGKAYQVWLLGASGVHSAGLLAPDGPHRIRPLLADLPGAIDRVGITAEPAGGSPAPTVPAVVMVDLV